MRLSRSFLAREVDRPATFKQVIRKSALCFQSRETRLIGNLRTRFRLAASTGFAIVGASWHRRFAPWVRSVRHNVDLYVWTIGDAQDLGAMKAILFACFVLRGNGGQDNPASSPALQKRRTTKSDVEFA